MALGREEDLRHAFLDRLRENEITERIMEHFPDNVDVFVKDAQGRFMMANRSFWTKMGLEGGEQIIGKTDYDFFWSLQAEAYRHDDGEVLRTGTPQINKPEIIPTADGMVDWYQTTKIPLRGKDGGIEGLVGIIRDLRSADSALSAYRTLEPVVRHIMTNYAKPLRLEEMADVAGLSPGYLIRRFKQEFGVTPGRYLSMVRLNAACRLLLDTTSPISEVALKAGFYDHSFFTKQFLKYKGLTPKEFRIRFRDLPDRKKFFPLGDLTPRSSARESAELSAGVRGTPSRRKATP